MIKPIGTTNTPSFIKVREVTLNSWLIWYGMTLNTLTSVLKLANVVRNWLMPTVILNSAHGYCTCSEMHANKFIAGPLKQECVWKNNICIIMSSSNTPSQEKTHLYKISSQTHSVCACVYYTHTLRHKHTDTHTHTHTHIRCFYKAYTYYRATNFVGNH